MELIEVNVIGSEAFEGCMTPFNDVISVAAPGINAIPHAVENLGRKDGAGAVRALKRFTRNFFRATLRIHVRGVDKVNAFIECPMHHLNRI
jgi:hypothetical protein